jgi:hypothetical protein
MSKPKSQIFPTGAIRYIEKDGGEFFISVNDLCHQLFQNSLITASEIMEELGEKRVFKEVK